MIISFSQPLDLTATLESGQAFRWRREDPASPGWYQGVAFNNLVRLRRTSEGVEFLCAPDDESTIEPLVRDYLRLEDDLEAIYRAIDLDERMSDAIARFRGMRLLRQDPWECLVSFICSSNSNIPRIATNTEDMALSFGQRVRLGDQVRNTFPTAEALADAGEKPLRELGLGFRAKYVAPVARTVADGDLDLFALREAPYQEALEALTELPGVGDKVANCVLLFSLDKLEAFPVDVWVHRVLQEWYLAPAGGDGAGAIPRAKMRPWAQQHFGPYAGYANQYLFHHRRLQTKD